MPKPKIGLMFRREYLPETLPALARRAEEVGFDELWLIEDCFYAGGIAQAGVALASTHAITVGLGIMPAVARNAAFSAMEIATLSRIYPERFLPGIGHGVKDWMDQIGALPKSQLTAIENYTTAIRAILRGESVNFTSAYVQLRDVQLEYPLASIPPISLGVRGPKSLQLSGQIADGTIMAEGASAAYVEWAVAQIQQGQADAGRKGPHRVTVYMVWAPDHDIDRAQHQLRPIIANILGATGPNTVYTEPLGITADVQALLANGGLENLSQAMPNEWLDHLAIFGTPAQCQQSIQALHAAGAHSVVLVPIGDADSALTAEAFWG